jgi:hypothetical protein
MSPASASPARLQPAITEEVLSLVQNLQPAPRTALPIAAASSPANIGINGSASSNGHSTHTATLDPPERLVPEEVLAPPKEVIESLVRPLIESTARPAEPVETFTLSGAMELQAELLLDSIAQRNAAEQAAVLGIVASFQQVTKNLLAPASQVVEAPAPVCLQWMRIPRPRLLHVLPKDLDPRDLMSGVQTPPLAGPVVPNQLRNLTEILGAGHRRTRKKVSLPAWTVSFLIALTLFLAVGSLLQYLAANRDAKAAAAATMPAPDSASATVATSAQPASKLVEVTGLRVASGVNHRPQLAFIVVNHSANQLSGIGLQIAVRSGSSSDGIAPLFRVSTTIPSLGPYQSREFRAELDPEVHATEIPDWQSLRADVHVNTQ